MNSTKVVYDVFEFVRRKTSPPNFRFQRIGIEYLAPKSTLLFRV